jgi:hypothetical protein
MAMEAAELLEQHDERARLRAIAGKVQSSPVLASQRPRPVGGPFAAVFPQGLRPGTSVAVTAARPALEAAALRNAITLAAGVVPNDGWVAAVGLPSVGVLAAAEVGLALDHLVFFALPGERTARRGASEARGPHAEGGGRGCGAPPGQKHWGTVSVAAVDAFDVVVLAVPARPRLAEVRRLVGRARERGTTIIATGAGASAWGGEARVNTAAVDWEGLGCGYGTLRECRVTIELDGRGSVRPRTVSLVL